MGHVLIVPNRVKKTKLRVCPRGCTQHRNRKNRLLESRTFDGTKCHKCGFEIKSGYHRVEFQKFIRTG